MERGWVRKKQCTEGGVVLGASKVGCLVRRGWGFTGRVRKGGGRLGLRGEVLGLLIGIGGRLDWVGKGECKSGYEEV